MRRIGLLAFAMACCAAHTRIAAAVDEIYADGFDGPKWFLDADGDGYGDPGVFVRSATQPLGYVANSLDCDDSSAGVHPGAPDDPDAAFVDSNCDGIDGDIAKAIFVETAGVDGPACGTMASPCATPQYALGRLDAQHTQVYLQVGTYAGALTVDADAQFYGGYDAQWHRAAVSAGGPNAQLQGANAAMGSLGSQAFAIYAAPSVNTLFADVEVDAPDAAPTLSGNGLDSHAVYVDQDATLQLLRSRIVQGKGADGAAGFAGTDALQVTILPPAPGGDAAQYSSTCDNTSHGSGAAPSINECGSGSSTLAGKGGDGGTMDTNCTCCVFDFTARPGSAGQDSPSASGGAGKGGSGGSGGSSCGTSQAGTNGFVHDGSGGISGIGSSLVGGLWVADHGGAGTLGDNGGGGGGGGGSGGCDNGTDSFGAGGGGGGAGGCAALASGTGGGGGGASFGVFALGASSVTATGNTFVLGTGGNGGHGGRAGIGQTGGQGGQGGMQAANGSAPGNGGDGGRGGVAGGGGGGQGGSVFGIYSYASTITQSGNAFTGGVAGSAGAGGTSSNNSGVGQDGADGIVSDVGSCAVATSCN